MRRPIQWLSLLLLVGLLGTLGPPPGVQATTVDTTADTLDQVIAVLPAAPDTRQRDQLMQVASQLREDPAIGQSHPPIHSYTLVGVGAAVLRYSTHLARYGRPVVAAPLPQRPKPVIQMGAQSNANGWAVGNLVYLCQGTWLFRGPGPAYDVHTIVPVDWWGVTVVQGPIMVDGEAWWKIDRRAAGDPSGGQGYTIEVPEEGCEGGGPGNPNDPGSPGYMPLSARYRALMRGLGGGGAIGQVLGWQGFFADPVNSGNGNFAFTEHRLIVPGVAGHDLGLSSSYNSRDDRDGVFGLGWSSLLDMSLRLANDGSVDVRYADGSGAFFEADGAGFVPGQPGVLDELRLAGTEYILTTPAQLHYHFALIGGDTVAASSAITETGGFVYLTAIKDRNANTISIERNASGAATTITDSAGRAYTLSYAGAYLTTIADSAGRTFTFTYADNLMMSASDGNGGVTTYGYENNLLTNITDPTGVTYLQNRYDGEGRVIEQLDARSGRGTFAYSDGQGIFIDALGNRRTDTYDTDGRRTTTTNALEQSERFVYDPDTFRITDRTDRRGKHWFATYDAQGNQLATTDPLGHTVITAYNDFNDPTSVTDQGGSSGSARTTSYAYDARGNLTLMTFADGTSVARDYDARGQLVRLRDPNGGETTFTYDTQGNMLARTDPERQTTSYTYDSIGRVLTVTDANQHTTSMTYDNNSNVLTVTDPKSQTTNLSYDPNNNLVRVTDRVGGVWRYTYDASLNLIASVDPEGHVTAFTYDLLNNRETMIDPRGNGTQYTYDAIYRPVTITDALGGITRYGYDENDNLVSETDANQAITTHSYDAANQRTGTIDPLSHQTAFAYDAVGRLIKRTNARIAITSYEYNTRDRLTLMVDALGGNWSFGYDANGNLTSVTDANQHTAHMRYDGLDRLIETIDAGGHRMRLEYDGTTNVLRRTNPRGFVTRYRYDANDNLAELTDALGGVTSMDYDAEDRMISLTDANRHTTSYAYSRDGLLIQLTEAGGQVSRFRYDPAHNLEVFTNAKGNRWVSTYDALNRQESQADPLGNTTRYRYDAVGQLIQLIDANTIVTCSQYDLMRRLSAVIQNCRSSTQPDHQTNVTTRYQHDEVGNVTTVVRPSGAPTRFEYDLLDRMTRETDPRSGVWSYRHDAVGNVIERRDAKQQVTTYAYNADDLLTSISYSDGQAVQFTYDEQHNQIGMHDSLGLSTNQYDALDRLIASTNHLGQRVESSYDPVSNRIGFRYPDGRLVRSAYDPTNFLVKVTDPDGWVFDFTRDPTHNVVLSRNPNNTKAEYDIDAAERLTAVRNLTGANPHETISSVAYTLDPVGNKLRTQAVYRWRKPTTVDTRYQYDPLYRLTRSQDAVGNFTSYGYDVNSNRTSLTTNDDPTLVRKINTETTTFTYNQADELIGSVREVQPRGNADRTSQTAQGLRAYIHEVAAQRGHHLSSAAADNLTRQANALLEQLSSSRPPDRRAVAAVLAELERATSVATEDTGIVNSLLVKLRHAAEANEGRGGELMVTLYDTDANGNRIRRTQHNDGTGNQRDWLRSDYFYDIENRLTHEQDFRSPNGQTWLPADETFLQYDGYGRAFRRQHDQHIGGGGQQHWIDYVYDGLTPVAEYRNPSPQYTNYYRGNAMILSAHDFKSQQSPVGTLTYSHYDGLGTMTGLTKHQGQSVHNYRPNDFGIILDNNGHAADASNFTDPHNHYVYTGHEWDEYLELHHTYAREYDPFTGTWLQRDPYRGQLDDSMSLHRYAYVEQNPINYTDPLGYSCERQSCSVFCVIRQLSPDWFPGPPGSSPASEALDIIGQFYPTPATMFGIAIAKTVGSVYNVAYDTITNEPNSPINMWPYMEESVEKLKYDASKASEYINNGLNNGELKPLRELFGISY